MDRRDANSPGLRAQIEAGGHGGLSPRDLSDYRHQIEYGAREFERVAVTIRRCALQHAVEVCGDRGDPENVLDAAARFEAFLIGGSATTAANAATPDFGRIADLHAGA